MNNKKQLDFFQYTQAELEALKTKDKKLAALIDRYGFIERAVNKDVFAALVGSIISQQISGKAAETVEGRLLALCGEITPARIYEADLEDIQRCGMSMRKARYIKEAASAVYNGSIDIMRLQSMADEEIVSQLTELPGIGVWTAEMLLIFSLRRMNVLSYGDLAIRRGLCKLYGHQALTKELFATYQKRYSPYGSIASLYLWRLSVEQSF
jgi:3-methyladenine DNA glycosylase/8-oxoguanine DNA glycosylase